MWDLWVFAPLRPARPALLPSAGLAAATAAVLLARFGDRREDFGRQVEVEHLQHLDDPVPARSETDRKSVV